MVVNNNKKIKLAIVETSMAIGGVQKLVLDQLRTLDREKFDIHLIILTQPDRETFYSLLPSDITLTKLNFTSTKDIKSWFELIRTLRGFKPDVVKSSMYFSNTIVRLLKPFLGYVSIAAEHNTNDGKGPLQQKLNRILNRLSYTTIVDSNLVADHLSLSEKLPRERFTVIHNGVDIDSIEKSKAEYLPQRDSLRNEYGIKKEDKVFLTIGRMVRQKNHIRMVEAFSILLKTDPNCKLIIIGEGNLRQAIIDRVEELSIGNKVIILEARKDIHKFYVMSDVTLLSSDHEGFCIAAMEGLAFGAPLVSPRVAGVVEYLEDGKNGFFAEKTPDSLAEKMHQLVNLPEGEFIKFKEASQRTALNYSLEKYGRKLAELLMESVH